ncbi:hypothetical protein [Rhodovulum marinum]|uniref:Uncharacterized protein n=1 Tax=Rhodovulum marinum TaxID=320662 RepID=A0A4R2Q5Y2_9RHOB|nr:hypothetical protein [Rhodovulum marinum]TCP43228.1 hypothetical protein EV662_102425 [Rhodovulum marinum]
MTWTELFDAAFLRDVLAAVLAIALGVWLPALFAFRRFRTRQWWEKKAAFYQEVIAVLGNLKRLEDRDLQDEMDGRDPGDDHRAHVAWDHEEANQHLRRLSNEGVFLLSRDSQDVLARYFRDIALAIGKETLRDRLIFRAEVTNDALMDVIAAARTDLGVRE